MNDDSITLSGAQIAFLMFTFDTYDPDQAVDEFIELLVFEGVDPQEMKTYLEQMMIKERAHVNN